MAARRSASADGFGLAVMGEASSPERRTEPSQKGLGDSDQIALDEQTIPYLGWTPMSPPDQGYTWVDRPIARSPMSMGYRLGLAVVSLMMVLLPAVYVGLCFGMGFGIYTYATDSTFLLGLKQVGIIAYFAPLIAGCIGLIFMVKPLFTRPHRIAAHLDITREQQARLFQFIDEVCARIGAPKPVRVRLDNQVNASASFEHGWWGVINRRLVLTIGLPLAQGLTVSQFGGVLAHEFGHFTQSAAMRFNYVIRATNGWFARVIYERDHFDAKLFAWSKRGTYYSIITANIARGFVWLARKILWLLMRAGHAVSAYLMRQMEYDADHYELEVAGAKNFRETFLLMRLMNAGAQMAGNHLTQLWKDGKLVDNVPLLTDRLVANLPGETVRQLRAGLDTDQSIAPWHATHPSDPERIARSTGRDDAGALLGDNPAPTLFADFATLAQKLTLIDYKERFNLKVKPEALVPTETYLQDSSARADRIKAMADFFGGLLHENRLIFPDGGAEEDITTLDAILARYRDCARRLEESRASSDKLCREIEAARSRRAQAYAAQMFKSMDIPIKAANFNLPNLEWKSINRAIETNSAEVDRLQNGLEPVMELARGKFYYFCRIAESPEWLSRARDDAEWNLWLARIATLKSALLCLRPIRDHLAAIRKSFFLATICVENFESAKNKPATEKQFESFAADFMTTIARIHEIGSTVPYPLADGKDFKDVTAYFAVANTQTGSVGRYVYLRGIFERYTCLYTEITLELLEKLTAVEKAPASDGVSES
jgi:Zn-dependent protease with chaperone function